MKRSAVFLLPLLMFFSSFAVEKPKLLGAVKGDIIPYIEKLFPAMQIKSVGYVDYSVYAGRLYILKKYITYTDFYESATKMAEKNFEKVAAKKCKGSRFYALDHIKVDVNHVGDGNILLVTSANLLCIDF